MREYLMDAMRLPSFLIHQPENIFSSHRRCHISHVNCVWYAENRCECQCFCYNQNNKSGKKNQKLKTFAISKVSIVTWIFTWNVETEGVMSRKETGTALEWVIRQIVWTRAQDEDYTRMTDTRLPRDSHALRMEREKTKQTNETIVKTMNFGRLCRCHHRLSRAAFHSECSRWYSLSIEILRLHRPREISSAVNFVSFGSLSALSATTLSLSKWFRSRTTRSYVSIFYCTHFSSSVRRSSKRNHRFCVDATNIALCHRRHCRCARYYLPFWHWCCWHRCWLRRQWQKSNERKKWETNVKLFDDEECTGGNGDKHCRRKRKKKKYSCHFFLCLSLLSLSSQFRVVHWILFLDEKHDQQNVSGIKLQLLYRKNIESMTSARASMATKNNQKMSKVQVNEKKTKKKTVKKSSWIVATL